MMMQLWGIHEFLLLNTCNRVEIIAVVSSETAENGILPHSMGFAALKENKFYIKTGKKAFEHLCLVTAGMLSQTPEKIILPHRSKRHWIRLKRVDGPVICFKNGSLLRCISPRSKTKPPKTWIPKIEA